MEAAAMSLSAREEQLLGSIEDGLARSDPKLAWMLGTFTRLASGEEMPVREKIDPACLVASLRHRPHPGRDVTHRDVTRRRARRLYQRLGFPQYRVLWLATVVAVALVAVALVVSRGGGSSSSSQGSCPTSWSAVCTAPASTHSSQPAEHKTASGQALSPAG
jgi:hypothetical protein